MNTYLMYDEINIISNFQINTETKQINYGNPSHVEEALPAEDYQRQLIMMLKLREQFLTDQKCIIFYIINTLVPLIKRRQSRRKSTRTS